VLHWPTALASATRKYFQKISTGLTKCERRPGISKSLGKLRLECDSRLAAAHFHAADLFARTLLLARGLDDFRALVDEPEKVAKLTTHAYRLWFKRHQPLHIGVLT
jgi:hypothetical protein